MHANVRRLNPPLDRREAAVGHAVELVRARVADRASHETLLADFLEDDLRECRRALEEVDGWYDELLELLADPGTQAFRLIDHADDPAVLEQVEYLMTCLSNLQKRLRRVAAGTPR